MAVLDSVARRGHGTLMIPFLPPGLIADAYQPPLIAFVVSLVVAAALAGLGLRRFVGLGAAVGLCVALVMVFGVRMVTPRMLPERVMWLVLGAGVVGLAGEVLRLRGVVLAVLAACVAGVGAWFMLGAPRVRADLARVLAEFAVVGAGFSMVLWRLVPIRAGSAGAAVALAAAVLLSLGLWLGGAASVFVGLAACVAGAALAVLLVSVGFAGAPAGLVGVLVLGAALAGVAAAAGLAQRSPAVWTGCAAPLLGLLAGPALATRLGLARGGSVAAIVGAVAAGAPLLGLAALL